MADLAVVGCRVLCRQTQQRADDGCHEHRQNSGHTEPQCDGSDADPGGAGINDQLLALGESARHDEGADHRRGNQSDDPGEWRWRLSSPGQDRTERLHQHGPDGQYEDQEPRFHLRSPISAAAAATSTGTPGGVMGVRARVMAAAKTATMIGRKSRDAAGRDCCSPGRPVEALGVRPVGSAQGTDQAVTG